MTLTVGATFIYVGAVFIGLGLLTAIAEHLDRKEYRRRRDAHRRRQLDVNRLVWKDRDWWMT